MESPTHDAPCSGPVNLHTVVTGPPSTPTFRNSPSAEKPIQRPSEEKNGNLTPTASATFTASRWLRDRTINRRSVPDTNANVRPSRDNVRSGDVLKSTGGTAN